MKNGDLNGRGEWVGTNDYGIRGLCGGIVHYGNSEGKGSLNYGNHLYMVCYGYFLH